MSTTRKRKQVLMVMAFVLPFFILYTLFTIWPVLQGVYVSMHKWTLMGKIKFVGLDNYMKFFSDKKFVAALCHTLYFVVITTPSLVITALILALFANRPNKLKKGLRICYYLPSVLSVSVASFIAKYMFTPYRGFINGFLHFIHVLPPEQEIQWLNETNLAWSALSSMTVWWTVGFSMLLYLSALQEVPSQVYEAASIDGANKRQQLFAITLPLLKPTTYLVILLQMIASFKVFGQIYMITKGGPAGSTRSLIQYIYETAFKKNNMGYAAAMSYVLLSIMIILTIIQKFIETRGGKSSEN